jgi:hypothetical protein
VLLSHRLWLTRFGEDRKVVSQGRILTRSRPPSSVFSLTRANNPMNTGDSAVSPVLIPSTCSHLWAQFLSKTDTKYTKKPSA